MRHRAFKILSLLDQVQEIVFNEFMVRFFFFLFFTFFIFNLSPANAANFSSGSDTLENPKPAEPSKHTLVFTTTKAVPSDGDILITVPAVNATGQTNNGIADSASTVQANGFDLNNISASNVKVSSSGCANNWGIGTITEGTATTDHKIRIYRVTDSCAAGSTITVVIGDSSKKILNPGPLSTPSKDGKADIYTIHIRSRDGSGTKLDQLDVRIALLGPVVVSATVGETFSFTLSGVSASSSACGIATDTATTASTIPWGIINKPFVFQNAAQLITVSTNAKDGYVVTVSEDDQLKRNDFTCQGPNPKSGTYCIPDTKCDNETCTESLSANWSDHKKAGFGFSLENLAGADAGFLYNEGNSVFSARQFPDSEAQEEPIAILSGNAPVLSSSVNVCYRISIADIQPAGYYTNHLLYTASPKF